MELLNLLQTLGMAAAALGMIYLMRRGLDDRPRRGTEAWTARGFTGELQNDGPHMRLARGDFELRVQPLPDGRVERSYISLVLLHPRLGGDFTVALDDALDSPRRPDTGDPDFDARAHLLTVRPLEAMAWLGEARRTTLLQLGALGRLRLTRGRLEILMPNNLPRPQARLAAQVESVLDRAAPLVDAAPGDPLPVLLERVRTGPAGERVAVARLLRRELGVLPEVGRAVAALLRTSEPEVRRQAVRALGDVADHDALATDAALPAWIRLEAWLAGSLPELPDDLVLDPVCLGLVRNALQGPLSERALVALGAVQDPALLEAVQRFPASPERAAVLDRLRAHQGRLAGQLSLANAARAGELRIVDEAGGLSVGPSTDKKSS